MSKKPNERGEAIKLSVGRPRKITDEQVDVLCDTMATGLTDEEACACAGVNYDYFRKNWSELEYLRDTVKAAKAKKKLLRLQAIEEGGAGWQSKAWILERTDPQFRKTPDVQVNNAVEARVNIDATKAELIKAQLEVFKAEQTTSGEKSA